MSDSDERFMDIALRLAERGLGCVWPNPSVGCVVVRDNRLVGRGRTRVWCHAEREVLEKVGRDAYGATVYVTLEPCCHEGRTPPCTEALIQAGVGRIVLACRDPDSRVDGRGIVRLREAGIEVVVGVGAQRAWDVNEGFFLRITEQRPLVTLKVVTSLDGRIATCTGDSKWISSVQARAWTHGLRLRHDALLVGRGTVEVDDPMLTCRLSGIVEKKVRIILDTYAGISVDSRVVKTALQIPTWLVVGQQAKTQTLSDKGVEIIPLPLDQSGRLPPQAILHALARRGLTRVLLEGGAEVATSFLQARLVDRIIWVRSPLLLGAGGKSVFGDLGIEALLDSIRLQKFADYSFGDESIVEFRTLFRGIC